MDLPDSTERRSAPPLPPSGWDKFAWIFGGAVGGVITTALLYLALIFLGKFLPSETANILRFSVVPSILLVPICGGLVAAWVWGRLNLRIGEAVLYSFGMAVLGVAGASALFHEGIVCLAMAFPILWVAMLTGVLVGRIWFRPRPSRLNVCILPVVLLVAAAEIVTRVDTREVVIDEVLIHAPPERVWPHVLAFSEIQEAPTYWIFRLGLPYPVATTNGGNHIGADRQCIFSDGIVLKEKVAEYVQNRRLTFDIVEQPTHPEAYGHITLHRGQFDLRDNRDGTTTLIGSSWYTLHVRPQFYFDWWTRDMTREVHLRVMRHIRRLSEEPV